jgi:spore germination protein
MRRILWIALVAGVIAAGCNQGAQPRPEQARPHPPTHQQVKTEHPKISSSPTITTVGDLEPVDPREAGDVVEGVGKHLSYVAFFSYRVKPDGSLIPLKDEYPLRVTKRQGAVPMLVITNFAGGNFQPDIAHSIFTDRSAQRRLIRNVIRVMKKKGYGALNVDFEHIREEDRELYNAFLKTFLPRMRREGFVVSTALAPKTSDRQGGPWHGAHDYAVHGKLADFVILMTYEWGWTGGPPMAVAPVPQVRDVLDYAVRKIPRNKIVMGAPLYGYDWTLPYRKGGPPAKRLSPREAAGLAKMKGARVLYSNRDQAPYYYYRDDRGKEHVVWYENEESMQAKFNLVKEYRLRGISYWVLGEEFPQNWRLLRENFHIRKAKKTA